MIRVLTEFILYIPAVLTTGFVLFLPCVIQKIMNEMDGAEFKIFLTRLTKYALKSPYAIAVSTVTFVGMIPYWYFFGFDNTWFSAGIVMWIISSIVSKQMTLPIYSRVTGNKIPGYKKQKEIPAKDEKALKEECRKLRTANIVRAALCVVSVAMMTIGFF